MRRATWLGATLVALLVGAGCSGSKPASFSSPKADATSTTLAALAAKEEPDSGPAVFTLGAAGVPDPVRQGVQATLDRYVNSAVVTPLRTGQTQGDLSDLFVPAALARVVGADRPALVDDGMPKAQRVRVEAATADLEGISISDDVQLVVARIGMKVVARIGGTPLTIERTGDLELVRDGDGWKISGYQVRASKSTPGSATTAVGSTP